MCRALREKGIDVLLVTTDADLNGSITASHGAPTSYKEIPTIFFPKQWHDAFKYSRPLAQWLAENVKGFNLVHIHAVFNHACIAAASACRRHGVPYIVRPLGTIDPWSMKQKPLRKRLFWYGAVKTMLQSAAGIHYTARGEQEAAEQSLELNHGFVIPLGVEIDSLNTVDDGERFREECGSLVDHPYVLVLSRLHPQKGLDVLLGAFLALCREKDLQNWLLVLAGDGPVDYVNSLRATVKRHRAEAVVLFSGWLDGERKVSALRGASLLVLPSYRENFGLCVMESLACGVPVLISPNVNLAPEVQAAGAGWIAPVEEDELKNALADALRSPDERARRGEAGKRLAQQFTWQRCATALIELYRTITHVSVGNEHAGGAIDRGGKQMISDY